MVSPPPDVGNQPTQATATRPAAAAPERGAPPPSGPASALDRADIKPLDVSAALQILVAEVREAFTLLLIEAGATSNPGSAGSAGSARGTADPYTGPGNAVAAADIGTAVPVGIAGNPDSAGNVGSARALVDTVLQSLPETLDEAAWSEALPQVEAALQAGVQRAFDVVNGWRDVSPVVLEATQASAKLALQVLSDEPQNPLWLRPEWLAMAPRLARFWRRRRKLRRRLTDPDYDTNAEWDEGDGYAP
jgi:hypothetical protein